MIPDMASSNYGILHTWHHITMATGTQDIMDTQYTEICMIIIMGYIPSVIRALCESKNIHLVINHFLDEWHMNALILIGMYNNSVLAFQHQMLKQCWHSCQSNFIRLYSTTRYIIISHWKKVSSVTLCHQLVKSIEFNWWGRINSSEHTLDGESVKLQWSSDFVT